MPAYQPVGIFVGQPQTALDQLRASALERITGGDITSVSEPGTSYGKSYRLSPDQILREVQYAEGVARGNLPARQTRPNFGGISGGVSYGLSPATNDHF